MPGGGWDVVLADGTHHRSGYVLAGCAPYVLDRLRARPGHKPQGSQTKINLVLRRLPAVRLRNRSGDRLRRDTAPEPVVRPAPAGVRGRIRRRDPRPAAGRGLLPHPDRRLDPRPGAAILRLAHPDHVRAAHPGRAVRVRPERIRSSGSDRPRCGRLQSVLAEPLEHCLARDTYGRPCIEVMTPGDVEAAVGMPGGHIFHGDLSWPWLPDGAAADDPGRALGRRDSRRRDPAVRFRRRPRRSRQRARRSQRGPRPAGDDRADRAIGFARSPVVC